jgi:hypothetical protein
MLRHVIGRENKKPIVEPNQYSHITWSLGFEFALDLFWLPVLFLLCHDMSEVRPPVWPGGPAR